jgi:hypothetical protein
MKKTVFLFSTLSLVLGLQLNAQSTQERNVSDFDAIQVSDGIDLFLKQGNSVSLEVKANESVINDIETRVEGNRLIIEMKNKNYRNWGRNRKEVYIVLKDLKKISASGGSDIVSETLKLNNFSISTSGGSDMTLELEVQELSIAMSGGSDLNLKGSATKLDIRASGGSDLSARNLKVGDCKIVTSGGSDASIYVTGDLSMTASGASDINYSGSPNVVSSRSSGGADINKN